MAIPWSQYAGYPTAAMNYAAGYTLGCQVKNTVDGFIYQSVGDGLWSKYPVTTGAIVLPAAAGTLACWHDPSQDAYNNNDHVVSPTDWSGASHGFGQATAGNQPIFKTNILGGRSAYLFASASAQCLSTSGYSNWKPSGNFTEVILVQHVSSASVQVYSSCGSHYINRTTDPGYTWNDYTNFASTFRCTFPIANAVPYLFITRADTSTTSWYLNSGNPIAYNAIAGGLSKNTYGYLGTYFDGASYPFDGYLFEYLWYTGAITLANLAGLINYFSAKYSYSFGAVA